jgi:hypothetical protein
MLAVCVACSRDQRSAARVGALSRPPRRASLARRPACPKPMPQQLTPAPPLPCPSESQVTMCLSTCPPVTSMCHHAPSRRRRRGLRARRQVAARARWAASHQQLWAGSMCVHQPCTACAGSMCGRAPWLSGCHGGRDRAPCVAARRGAAQVPMLLTPPPAHPSSTLAISLQIPRSPCAPPGHQPPSSVILIT